MKRGKGRCTSLNQPVFANHSADEPTNLGFSSSCSNSARGKQICIQKGVLRSESKSDRSPNKQRIRKTGTIQHSF